MNTLVGQFNLIQLASSFDPTTLVNNQIDVGVQYDITAEVVQTAVPEDYSYPDLSFYYATQGSNVNPTNPGRKLDGTGGLPHISPVISHSGTGGLSVGIISDQAISHDIQIVATFRTA